MTKQKRQFKESKLAWWDDNNQAMLICRISDRKQLDGVSLKAQEHHQKVYAESVGLCVAEIEPFQESAKRSKLRAQFHAALEKARRKNIRHLVFYVWDRIARNSTDAEIIEDLIREGEIILHVAAGGAVLHANSDDSDFFMLDINIAQAKQENRARRRKTIDGMEQRCRNGWYPSKVPSFYWNEPVIEDGRILKRGSIVRGPTEEGRRLVRREMELHFQGFSLDCIREKCLAEGLVPAKYIASYHRSSIDHHLKQKFYAAIPNPHDGFKSQFVRRGTWYEAKHDPIYSAEEWSRLQASFGVPTTHRNNLKYDGLFAQGPLSLRCANDSCKCKITYAPKVKPESGIEYKYYHCADGKGTHKNDGHSQINVREEDILAQLGTALDQITLTPDIAEAIAQGLNETHQAAKAAKARLAKTYEAEMVGLKQKEDRLFDHFDSGEIDRATYDRQLTRLRAEQDDCFAKLQQAQNHEDEKYLVTAGRVLELAKRAKSLWEGRQPTEKRDLLERLVCNPRLDGRTVRYDLRKPFDVISKMRGDEGWRPQRDSNTVENRRNATICRDLAGRHGGIGRFGRFWGDKGTRGGDARRRVEPTRSYCASIDRGCLVGLEFR